MAGDLSTPHTRSKCEARACVKRPTPHPKSSAYRFSRSGWNDSAYRSIASISKTPLWKNFSTSQGTSFFCSDRARMARIGSRRPNESQCFCNERRFNLNYQPTDEPNNRTTEEPRGEPRDDMG